MTIENEAAIREIQADVANAMTAFWTFLGLSLLLIAMSAVSILVLVTSGGSGLLIAFPIATLGSLYKTIDSLGEVRDGRRIIRQLRNPEAYQDGY